MTVDEICSLTKIDPWFLRQMQEIVAVENAVGATSRSKCLR